MHWVIVLSAIIYISGCEIPGFHVIIFTLLNDVTLMPIAYDRQLASRYPENPNVNRMFLLAVLYGVVQAAASLLFAFRSHRVGFAFRDYDVDACSYELTSAVWLQMAVGAQFSIFSTRAPR